MLASHVPAHGGPGGHLGPAQVAALSLDLVVGELHVLLQHVLGDVFLVTHGTRPLLAHFTHTRTHTRTHACTCTHAYAHGREAQLQVMSEAVPQPTGQPGRVLHPIRVLRDGRPGRATGTSTARDEYDRGSSLTEHSTTSSLQYLKI